MTADDLLNLLQAAPFISFRLYMTDGRILDVHHPEYVLIDRRGRSAVVFEVDDPSRPYTYDRQVTIMLLHVTRTEPLETASPR